MGLWGRGKLEHSPKRSFKRVIVVRGFALAFVHVSCPSLFPDVYLILTFTWQHVRMRTRLLSRFRFSARSFLCLYFYHCVVVVCVGMHLHMGDIRVAGLKIDKHFSAKQIMLYLEHLKPVAPYLPWMHGFAHATSLRVLLPFLHLYLSPRPYAAHYASRAMRLCCWLVLIWVLPTRSVLLRFDHRLFSKLILYFCNLFLWNQFAVQFCFYKLNLFHVSHWHT